MTDFFQDDHPFVDKTKKSTMFEEGANGKYTITESYNVINIIPKNDKTKKFLLNYLCKERNFKLHELFVNKGKKTRWIFDIQRIQTTKK